MTPPTIHEPSFCGKMSCSMTDASKRYPQVLGRDPGPNILDPFLGGLKCIEMVCLRPMIDFFGDHFRPLARYVAGGSEMVCPRTSFAVKTFGYTSFRKNPNHQELMVGKSKSLNSTGWREMRKNQTSLTHTIICKRFIIDFFSVAFRSVRILWPLTSSSLAYPIYKLL